jgi:membrane protease YdiL (CAAX protease family)
VNAATGIACVWACVAMTALVTVLSRRASARRWGDYRGHLLYFLSFFLLLGLVPATAAGFGSGGLAGVGLTVGRLALGLLIVAAAMPGAFAVAVVGMRSAALRGHYPLSRSTIGMGCGFWMYEAVYVLCYYSAWEFTFRGLLFLPMVGAIGLVPALAIQTALSTLMHIGSPESEVWGAVGGGLAFGLIAYFTGSVLYSFILHAAIGVILDALLRRRLRASA